MPEDLEGKSLASLVSNNKDAKSPCDYLNLLPRSLQDPWPTSGYFQLAEQCIPGSALTSTRTHASLWLQTQPCPNRQRGVGRLLSPQPPQILTKMYCLFPKAVSKAVLHHVLRVTNLKQQEQCQATTSSLKH